MKKIFALVCVMTATAIGCHSQVPPNPTTFTCPSTSGTAYTPLNQSSPSTGLTFSEKPASGTYCYIAQSVNGSVVSVPSNTAGPLTVASGQTASLSWSAPTTGPTPTGYVISRATASSSTILAPALGQGTVARLVKPALQPSGNIEAPKLIALKK